MNAMHSLTRRLLHLHPGGAVKTDIINPEINFDAVQSDFRTKRCYAAVCGHDTFGCLQLLGCFGVCSCSSWCRRQGQFSPSGQ